MNFKLIASGLIVGSALLLSTGKAHAQDQPTNIFLPLISQATIYDNTDRDCYREVDQSVDITGTVTSAGNFHGNIWLSVFTSDGTDYSLRGLDSQEIQLLSGLIGENVRIVGKVEQRGQCFYVRVKDWIILDASNKIQRAVQTCVFEVLDLCGHTWQQSHTLDDNGVLSVIDAHMLITVCLLPERGCDPDSTIYDVSTDVLEVIGDGRYNIYLGN